MTTELGEAVLRPVDCEDRWAWAFRVWVLVGLAWIVRAKVQHEGRPVDALSSDIIMREFAAALRVPTPMLARAIAISEGRVRLLASRDGEGPLDAECEALALPAALALQISQPLLRGVLLRAILGRCVFLLGEQSCPSFQTLSDRIVRPMLRALRAELTVRARECGETMAEVGAEVARQRKALLRVLASVVVRQRVHELGLAVVESMPVALRVAFIRADPAQRALAIERAKKVLTKSLSVSRVCTALKKGLGAPGPSRPRNPITEQARKQQALADEIEQLDKRARAMNPAAALMLVPLALFPRHSEEGVSRLHPWSPAEDWWRRACALTERVRRELIPALAAKLWPIQAVGG